MDGAWATEFLARCKQQRTQLAESLEAISSGTITLRSKVAGEAERDTTGEFIAHLERAVENLDALIERIEADLAA